MSSPHEYETPAAAILKKDKPNGFLLKGVPNPDSELYQTLESPKETNLGPETAGLEQAKSEETEPHLYQILQPPSTEASGNPNQQVDPAGYKQSGHNDPGATGSPIYQILQPPNEREMEKYTSDSELRPQYKTSRQKDTANGKPLSISLTCGGVLVLVLAVIAAISIVALVLALMIPCRCEDDIKELFTIANNHSSMLAAFEDLITQGNITCPCPDKTRGTCQCQAEIKTVTSMIAKNQVNIMNNEKNIDIANMDIGKLLATRAMDLENCNTTLEATCNITSPKNECITKEVYYQRPGQLVMGFTCVSLSESGLVVTAVVSANTIVCHCIKGAEMDASGEPLTPAGGLSCGLSVTKCDFNFLK